ncbi:DUF6194 family protein [Nocardia paucivorans]|uniref:DUF6194 family protein n=1 Tax=Nocardia paucivorans TaxID=114259 RepID=UPI0003097999|nr:DUF6194 family protein [Nocardia paucivorans]
MSIDEIIDHLTGLEGVLILRPGPGDGSPEITWGDIFCYYSPEGTVPERTQPFATIVTKNYPGDERSRLDRPGAFRLNVHPGRETFIRWTGRSPREVPDDIDVSVTDTVVPHPVYGSAGWLAIVEPGPRTAETARELLREAYDLARARRERRTASTQ